MRALDSFTKAARYAAESSGVACEPLDNRPLTRPEDDSECADTSPDSTTGAMRHFVERPRADRFALLVREIVEAIRTISGTVDPCHFQRSGFGGGRGVLGSVPSRSVHLRHQAHRSFPRSR